eukprot:gene29783-35962_t
MWSIRRLSSHLLSTSQSYRRYFSQQHKFPSDPVDYLHGIRRAVFQKIHPDLFTSVSGDILQKNVQCIHEFNDLWTVLSFLCGLITSSSSSLSVNARTVVKQKYELSCFIHPSSPDQDFKHALTTILMPSSLCGNLGYLQGLSKDAMYEHIVNVLRQKHAFTQQLDITNPWSDFLNDSTSSSKFHGRNTKTKSNPSLDMYIFDSVAKAEHSLSFVANKRNTHHKYVVQLQQIQDYLATEHIQFMDVIDKEGQEAVLQRLVGFFAKYGEMMNFFSPTVWRHIIIVVSRGTGRENVDYGVKEEGEYFIVKIPHKFKPAYLADFIHTNVPTTLPELKWR